ncbi:OprD family outer membrane porin [Erwinia aphidicola]|uniref:OprD family outer membrane porin n=1 Tax=Erwinia aphidicola TaxID=68334 RepID=UPI0030CF9A84
MLLTLSGKSTFLFSAALFTLAPLPLCAFETSSLQLTDSLSRFITDSHAEISFRNQFKNLNTSDSGDNSVQTAWGQGISLDYNSGYFADIIGLDASYYQVYKLAASDDFAGRSVLYNHNGHARGSISWASYWLKRSWKATTAI